MDFESWSTYDLVDYLVDKGVYPDREEALWSDRSDLLKECSEVEHP